MNGDGGIDGGTYYLGQPRDQRVDHPARGLMLLALGDE